MRRAFGVRARLLHERSATWGDGKDLDGEMFCWTGHTGADRGDKETIADGDSPQDHLVNVLAAEIGRNGGHVDVDALLKTWKEWTTPVEQPPLDKLV